jgi:predicted Holliday junction resolvase-like endonuclease
MWRLIVFLVVVGLVIAFLVELKRHNKKAQLREKLEEEERKLLLKQEKQSREKIIRRGNIKLDAEDKFSEVDDIFSTIDLTDKEEK